MPLQAIQAVETLDLGRGPCLLPLVLKKLASELTHVEQLLVIFGNCEEAQMKINHARHICIAAFVRTFSGVVHRLFRNGKTWTSCIDSYYTPTSRHSRVSRYKKGHRISTFLITFSLSQVETSSIPSNMSHSHSKHRSRPSNSHARWVLDYKLNLPGCSRLFRRRENEVVHSTTIM